MKHSRQNEYFVPRGLHSPSDSNSSDSSLELQTQSIENLISRLQTITPKEEFFYRRGEGTQSLLLSDSEDNSENSSGQCDDDSSSWSGSSHSDSKYSQTSRGSLHAKESGSSSSNSGDGSESTDASGCPERVSDGSDGSEYPDMYMTDLKRTIHDVDNRKPAKQSEKRHLVTETTLCQTVARHTETKPTTKREDLHNPTQQDKVVFWQPHSLPFTHTSYERLDLSPARPRRDSTESDVSSLTEEGTNTDEAEEILRTDSLLSLPREDACHEERPAYPNHRAPLRRHYVERGAEEGTVGAPAVRRDSASGLVEGDGIGPAGGNWKSNRDSSTHRDYVNHQQPQKQQHQAYSRPHHAPVATAIAAAKPAHTSKYSLIPTGAHPPPAPSPPERDAPPRHTSQSRAPTKQTAKPSITYAPPIPPLYHYPGE